MAAPKPISQMPADVSYRMSELKRGLYESRLRVVRDIGLVAKAEHLKVMRVDSGGDLKLSGVGKRMGKPGNAPIGVDVSTEAVGKDARTLISAEGPVHLIDRDTAGRVIRSAYLKGRPKRGWVGPVYPGQFAGSGRRAVLNIPGIGFRASARHPGTPGKRTWTIGRKFARYEVDKIVHKDTNQAVRRAAS